MKHKCDRCGKKYTPKVMDSKGTYPRIMGISERCVERVWEVCDKCLAEIITFLDFPQHFKCQVKIVIEPDHCIDCSVLHCWKLHNGCYLATPSTVNTIPFVCPRNRRCATWKEVEAEKKRIKALAN